MPIGKALLLKGLGGLTAIGGAIGCGCYLYDHFSNQDTKFDRGLIDYLNDGGDIQFSVKKDNTDITSFPSLTSGTPPTTVTIKVSVSTDTGGTNDGTLTDATTTTVPVKGKKETLQKLNKGNANTGTAWTWECKIVFEKSGSSTELKDKDKKKVFNDTDPKGLLNKLKESGNKNQKIKFIKDCAANRGKDKNKEINGLTSLTVTKGVITDANKIESIKTFKLIDNSEATKKLIPEDQSDFDHWFKNVGN